MRERIMRRTGRGERDREWDGVGESVREREGERMERGRERMRKRGLEKMREKE